MEEISFFNKLKAIFTSSEKKQAVLLIFFSMLAAIAQAFGVATIFPFINVMMNPQIVQHNEWLSYFYEKGNFNDTQSFLFFLGIMVFAVIVSSNVLSAGTILAKIKYVSEKNHALSKRLLKVYLSEPYAYFLEKNSSELGKNILAEIGQLISHIVAALFEIFIYGLMVIVMLIMLLLIDAKVTAGIIIFLGGSYGLMNHFIKKNLEKKGQDRLFANKERYRLAYEALAGIKTTKIMGNEKYFLEKFSYFSKKFAHYNVFADAVGEIPRYVMETIAFGGIVFFIIIMIISGQSVEQFLPLLSLYAFAGYRTLPSIHRFFNAFTRLYYNRAVLDKIYQDMIDEEKNKPAFINSKRTLPKLEFNNSIKLHDIVFCYKNSSSNVINSISLEIKKNSMIGFVGSTGCGKTTLVDIILGLLLPQKGLMLVDQTPIGQDNLQSWQQKIGYVPQDIYLSDDSVRNNIAFGIPEKEINDQQVKKVAEIVALDDFIENELPKKYLNNIGERGICLSGGQRQRVGLARALYHNPEVLVLDEATSSLDGHTEENVLQAIKKASASRTVIIIAHRLNTLKDCNQIYIMEHGQIVGKGKYQELIQHSKRFRKMAKISSE